MNPITANDPESRSPDGVAENIAKLKALFPELVTEGPKGTAVNVDVLKQLLGDQTVTDADEKYGLNWHGKRRARQLALTPSAGTLRPCPEESVDWETTQNLMIEGDNLEVLKLLQKSYAGKVKLIYIDPPYNTGKDFVYPDNFQDNIKNYLELTGQTGEGGRKLSSNTEASGRFHTDWLNMMYPRLKLARNLLREDGVIFISIDDGELSTLRMAANDIFGEENFLACFIWKSRQNKDNRTVTGASVDHEYVLSYGKAIRGASRNFSQYSNPDGDKRGDWGSANMVGMATADRRPNLHYDLINPATGLNYGCPEMGWRYERSSMANLIEEDRILWPSDPDGRPRRKFFVTEFDSDFTGFSTIVGDDVFTRDGTTDVDKLFEVRIFDFPKPVRFVSNFVEQGAQNDEIILDFFAGSGTTGHAVMAQNVVDRGQRRYILVQLPETIDPANRDQKTASDFCDKLGVARTIAELTKERLRRAGAKIREELTVSAKPADSTNGEVRQAVLFSESTAYAADATAPAAAGVHIYHSDTSAPPASKSLPDLGFRVFKLASSNILAWDPDRDKLQETLEASVIHLKTDRSEQDILYELLLKRGIDLCTPIEVRQVAGHEVHSIGVGTLLVCLSPVIPSTGVEALALGLVAWHRELAPTADDQKARDTVCIFRDSAFADDVAKTNLCAILQQHGLETVRSL